MPANEISCRGCGTLNSADALYCRHCGDEIAGVVHCKRCGASQLADSRFCTACGMDLLQGGLVVPEVSDTAPTQVDRCECGGLMKPAHKYGDGALKQLGGWLGGGERQLFWECQECGVLKLHEAEIEKQKKIRRQEQLESAMSMVGCTVLLAILVGVTVLLVRGCPAA
ncbi:MAG: zinc ribbon domain-containing protein [Planctomycetes bacterium]|nr:zinc ribbon domain-containing protein [Planctomycetota bacterium]